MKSEPSNPKQGAREAANLERSTAKTVVDGVISNATEYTIVAVFVLYSLGFIIWHSYLGQYGCASIGFLQAEYLSAAFCYLFTLIVVGVTLMLLGKLVHTLFPRKRTGMVPKRPELVALLVVLVAAAVPIALRFCTPKVPWAFGISALLLYTGVIAVVASWNTASLFIKAIVGLVGVCALLSNVTSFATGPFGMIPRALGGGKPEIAYMKLSQQDLPLALNITGGTNNLVGPIAVFLKTEKDITFVNQIELTSPEYITSYSTNDVVMGITTNSIRIAPHFVNNNITVDLNRTTTSTTFKNPSYGKITAKQVRAELVDAIIFVNQ